jgi:hypothetical protein
MGVVFDEVVGEMRPDDEGGAKTPATETPAKHPDVDEVCRALERRRRLDLRLSAH